MSHPTTNGHRALPTDGSPAPSIRPLLLAAVRGAMPPAMLLDALRGGGGTIGVLVGAALIVVAAAQVLERYRSCVELTKTQVAAERLKASIAIHQRAALDCRLITWFGLLSPLAVGSRFRSGSLDGYDLALVIVLAVLALCSHFAWLPAIKRDSARPERTR